MDIRNSAPSTEYAEGLFAQRRKDNENSRIDYELRCPSPVSRVWSTHEPSRYDIHIRSPNEAIAGRICLMRLA